MKFTRLLSLCNFLTLSMNHALFVMCILSERVTKVLHKLNVANTEYLEHRISRTQKILNSSPLVYYLGTATDKSLSLGHFIIVCPLFTESITIAKKEQLTLRPV